MGPAEGPDDVAGRAARPGLGGVVPLKDLAPLADRLWLVIDDVHELGSADAPAVAEEARRLQALAEAPLAPADGYGAIGSRCWPAPAAVTSAGHNKRLGLPR